MRMLCLDMNLIATVACQSLVMLMLPELRLPIIFIMLSIVLFSASRAD
jgi:hypothetical protein